MIVNANSSEPLPAAFVDLLFNGDQRELLPLPGRAVLAESDHPIQHRLCDEQYTTHLPPGVNRVVTIGTTAGQGRRRLVVAQQ
jgi:hypothetical protein